MAGERDPGAPVIELGGAEIAELGSPVGPHQDVGGLHVAMDHPRIVGVGQRRGHVSANPRCGLGVERPSAHQLAQRGALDQLECDPGPLVLGPSVEKPHDVGMIEAREQAGLIGEAACVHGIDIAQYLDGHAPVEHGVVGAVHVSHAAPPDDVTDPVAVTQPKWRC